MSLAGDRRVDPGLSRNRPHGNVGVLRIAVVVLFLVLGVRLAQMQLVDGAEYAERSELNRIIVDSVRPTRGLIFDRKGRPLVENSGAFTALITPSFLPDDSADRYRLYLYLEDLLAVECIPEQLLVDGIVQSLTNTLVVTRMLRVIAPYHPGKYVRTLLAEYQTSAPSLYLSLDCQAGRNNVGLPGSQGCYPGSFLGNQEQVQRLEVHPFVFGETVRRLVVEIVKTLELHHGCPDMVYQAHGPGRNGVVVVGQCRFVVV